MPCDAVLPPPLRVPHRLYGFPPSTLSRLSACPAAPDARVPVGKPAVAPGSVSVVLSGSAARLPEARGVTGPKCRSVRNSCVSTPI